MKIEQGGMQFHLPADLHDKLVSYRRRVWTIKTIEAVAAVIVLAAACYLVVFIADRLGETPSGLRGALLVAALAGLLVFLPWKLHRWIWRHRRLTQLARLLSRDQPRVGDRLLGVIELVENRHDRHASPALCHAAIRQVADDTRTVDFLASVPRSAHRRWISAAVAMLALACAAVLVPGAGTNALLRWLAPWADVPRYTFTRLVELPARKVVAIGEPFTLRVELAEDTVWMPRRAWVRYGDQPPIESRRAAGSREFTFQIPAQTEAGRLSISVGDFRHAMQAVPSPRPELTSLLAHIRLPDYLGYDDQARDARTGLISIVKGSRARFEATSSRPLAAATVNGVASGIDLAGERLASPPVFVDDDVSQEFRWTDVEGLAARSPFTLRIRALDDRAPTIQCSQLNSGQVILDEETLSFEVTASDDFGVKLMGVEWSGVEGADDETQPQAGEYQLAGGTPRARSLAAHGAFTPKQLGIKPQPIHLRVFAEDYLPDRPRVYSPVYRLYVLDRRQHAIWLTQQLESWQRQALEVRDEEQRLLETNEQLSRMTAEQLDQHDVRQQIARQAAAERANAQRLDALSLAGEQLINQAMRNPEFNAATLENWAQVLQTLKRLSKNEMPSVASRLAAAANARPSGAKPSSPKAPSVSDSVRAAGRDPEDAAAAESQPQSPGAGGSLQLPVTALPGGAGGSDRPTPASAGAGESIHQAVEEQQRLLAEFNRVMDQLAQIMQDLHGSTFVKRLKAAADTELAIANDLHDTLAAVFGRDPQSLDDVHRQLHARLQKTQGETAQEVQLIQEDLAAYFDRTKEEKYRQVHQEMKSSSIVGGLRAMTDALAGNRTGETIAQAEYWSDQLDRWAELLVGPGCANCGPSPAGKGDSLPPDIVLEVLRILKAEVDLRTATRVADQSRTVADSEEYRQAADGLCTTQKELLQRTHLVVARLQRLQETVRRDYRSVLAQLATASLAMQDAARLLAEPETGPPTIAAETEAIEALLLSRRAGSGSGGGGSGSTPGGGQGEGEAGEASALAGLGVEVMSQRREVTQSTGNLPTQIPDEFRAGLDAYFSALEAP